MEEAMSTIRKAIAQFLTAAVTWGAAVTVSDEAQITAAEWVVLAGGAVGAFLVWLVPNGPQQIEIVGEPVAVEEVDGERGAVEPGSAALGALVGLLVGYLLWRTR
jgi:hypothetical protein